jgi:hypothetical protein
LPRKPGFKLTVVVLVIVGTISVGVVVGGALGQGLTLVHFPAQRKHLCEQGFGGGILGAGSAPFQGVFMGGLGFRVC